jgi:hypothetical protein
MTKGQNPRDTALGLVGRINRATGRREGGFIGLTSQQAGYVNRAKGELADPAKMGDYLQRSLRDKRYDRMVLKAMRDEKPLAQADIQAITGRYSDRLLKHRADTIARTETRTARHTAQHEAMQQLIDSGGVRADQVTKEWSATGDARVRDSHAAMDGQKVRFGELFTTPSGAHMRFPQDTAFGAPASEVINCRCYMQVRVKYL